MSVESGALRGNIRRQSGFNYFSELVLVQLERLLLAAERRFGKRRPREQPKIEEKGLQTLSIITEASCNPLMMVCSNAPQ